jgi:3-oxoacyl-[acyl-carrier-protein] synthase III
MAYLSGLAFEVGEEADLDTVPELAKNTQLRDLYLRFGLEKYRRSDLPCHALAERSLARTMEQSEISPGDVDAFVYATSTFTSGSFSQNCILELLDRFAPRAYPWGLFLSECSNAVVAFDLAGSLIDSGRAANVLVVTADSFGTGTRMIEPELGLGSDGASSCLISKSPSDLRLDGSILDIDLAAKHWGVLPPLEEEVQARARRIQSLCSRTYEKYALSPDTVDALITNNFHLGIIRSMCALAGHPNGRKAFTGMLAEVAHVYASDMIINLASQRAARTFPSGSRIMLLATGSYTFASAVVTTMA